MISAEEGMNDLMGRAETPGLYRPEVLVRQQAEHFTSCVREAQAQGDDDALASVATSSSACSSVSLPFGGRP